MSRFLWVFIFLENALSEESLTVYFELISSLFWNRINRIFRRRSWDFLYWIVRIRFSISRGLTQIKRGLLRLMFISLSLLDHSFHPRNSASIRG